MLALMRYLHAAALGSSVGMGNAAHLLLRLRGEEAASLPRPATRASLAHALLREAHELGNTDASLELADALYDEASAATFSTNAAVEGGTRGRTTGDAGFVEALQLYKHTHLTVGDPEALYAIGYMHQYGLGTPIDIDEASRIFGELALTESLSDALPGVLAQLGVTMQQAASWVRGFWT